MLSSVRTGTHATYNTGARALEQILERGILNDLPSTEEDWLTIVGYLRGSSSRSSRS